MYKVGFTRQGLKRRVKACDGTLLLAMPTKQHVSALERAIHQRFKDKQVEGPGFKREWFKLSDSDLDWIRNLNHYILRNPIDETVDNLTAQ